MHQQRVSELPLPLRVLILDYVDDNDEALIATARYRFNIRAFCVYTTILLGSGAAYGYYLGTTYEGKDYAFPIFAGMTIFGTSLMQMVSIFLSHVSCLTPGCSLGGTIIHLLWASLSFGLFMNKDYPLWIFLIHIGGASLNVLHYLFSCKRGLHGNHYLCFN